MTFARVLQVLAYPGFVAVGLFALGVLVRSGDERRRRHAVGAFILYTVCASLGPGLAQRSAWPFPAWTVFQLAHPPEAREVRLLGLDARGDEHAIDGRAWEPFSVVELWAWAQHRLGELGPENRQAVGRHLLDLANASRAAVREGRPPGRFARYLGPLAAPLHIMPRHIWWTPQDAPEEPFTRLRIYIYSWNLEARRREPERVARTLLFEYPRP